MKKLLLFFLLLAPIQFAQGQGLQYAPEDLSRKDTLQVEQWLRAAKAFWEFGDYPELRRYCRRIIEFYPETLYAEEAQKLLKKTENQNRNRAREFMRNNPGLSLGF